MPEKPTDRQVSGSIFGSNQCIMNSNNLERRECSKEYTWTSRKNDKNTTATSEHFKGFVSNLLEMEIINDDTAMLLKNAKGLPYNPALVMDVRHGMVKTRKWVKHYHANTDVVTEAKRLILQEDVNTLAVEKELFIIDKEINSFKKQLKLSTKQLSDQMKDRDLSTYNRIRLNKNKSISISNMENVFNSSCNMSKSELFSNMKVNEELKELNKIADTEGVATNDGAMKGNIPKIEESCMRLQINEGFLYHRQELICSAWKRWKRFTLDKKLNTNEDNTSYTKNSVNQDVQTQMNRQVLRKSWNTWLLLVKEKNNTLSTAHSKLKREEKIDKFLKALQEKKQTLIARQAPALIKDLDYVKKAAVKNSKYLYCNSQPKNISNKQIIQENMGFQTKTFPCHLNNDYQNRFEIQQNIIEEQKSKLDKQSKLIKELQLEHLRLQTENSTKEAQKEINQTLSSCDLRLKPKAKQVKMRLSTPDVRVEFPERKLVVVSLKTVPTILTRMEKRAQEREKRWRLIKEKKQKLTEEKEKKEREEEEEKKQKEEFEKQQKIEEQKEKRKHEKEMEIQKKKEREKMSNLMMKASLHYQKFLMKKVICPLKQLVALKRKQIETAEKHYKTQLMCNYFQTWRTHVESIIRSKMYKATALYNRVLVKKVFRGLFQVYSEYIAKNQVASDFYDLHLQEHIFIGWHCIACTEHVATACKQDQAKIHYNRKLLAHCLKSWKQLPSVLQLEREKEQRKQIWRMKVQLLLSDFNPVLAVLEDSGLSC